MPDFKQRFAFEKLDLRGCLLHIEETSNAIQSTHHYPPSLSKLINEFALAAILLRDSIKIEASVTIQLRSSGDLSLLMADCMEDKRVRAIAEFDIESFPATNEILLNQLSNDATLAITITPKEGNRYQSIVPLKQSTLSNCLHEYFAYSEQLPSRFLFFSQNEKAFAISIHSLPKQHAETNEQTHDDFERISTLMNTLTEDEAFSLSSEDVLTRLFHQEDCVVYEKENVEFGCVCSSEKSLEALKSLGETDLLSLIEERKQEGKSNLSVDCHFCNQHYQFEFSELESIFKPQ